MKNSIEEGQTVPVSESILKHTLSLYKALFEAIYALNNNKRPKDSKSLDIYEKINSAGGKQYLDGMRDNNKTAKVAGSRWVNYLDINDKILQRQYNETDIYRLLAEIPKEQQEIKFLFYPLKKDGNLGYFMEHDPTGTGFYNIISIGMPFDIPNEQYPSANSFWNGSGIQTTIRHELQHATQSFYSKILKTKKWIGLPSKKIMKKQKDIFTSDSGKHYDIPIEISTDVQDEIDAFFSNMKKIKVNNKKNLKHYVVSFVGAKQSPMTSRVFLHYLKTNKDIWKWAVGKLLGAIEKNL